jgi:hypothetical protein
VNALILYVGMAALTADPLSWTQETYFNAESFLDLTARGQNPGQYDEEPLGGSPPGQTAAPYDPSGGPAMGDPGLAVPALGFGAVGPQPYRFGWSSRYDVGVLPSEAVHGAGASGHFSVFEANAAWRYTTGLQQQFPNLIYSWTPEFNYRSWDGPTTPNLPANVYRFASDFELATPGNYPLSMQLGFTPAFVNDFSANPTSDAFNYDARAVAFLRTSPQLMFALGAVYWHRVDDFLLPYAGIVYTPNDTWEFRLMFPKSRVSYFMGNWWGAATWAYAGLEYNVEAYQINLASPTGGAEKIQLADYRALLGLRTESRGVTGFVEAGWVLDRQVRFLHGTPGFDINSGFIGRIGLRF